MAARCLVEQVVVEFANIENAIMDVHESRHELYGYVGGSLEDIPINGSEDAFGGHHHIAVRYRKESMFNRGGDSCPMAFVE